MSHLRRLGDQLSVPIRTDLDGLLGRECPNSRCLKYFKIKPGTGLKGPNLPCHCPYCGHRAEHSQFYTQDQIRYAQSVAIRQVTDAVRKDLKKLEFNIRPRGPFGIGMSMKLQSGPSPAIRHYHEKRLETNVTCSQCGLQYAIYGVFAFCPDCSTHNSLQILNKNYELLEKQLQLGESVAGDLGQQLFDDALENAVSVFDAFGRELCAVNATRSTFPERARKISFQNLDRANDEFAACFGSDFKSQIPDQQWAQLIKSAQKRHLLAHKLGVTDTEYARKTGGAGEAVGRRAVIATQEVRDTVAAFRELAQVLFDILTPKSP